MLVNTSKERIMRAALLIGTWFISFAAIAGQIPAPNFTPKPFNCKHCHSNSADQNQQFLLNIVRWLADKEARQM